MNKPLAGERIKARCPKCKSTDFSASETVEEIITYSVRKGELLSGEGDHEQGFITSISCVCEKCGHEWKPRGARTLTDIIEGGTR